MVGAVVAGEGLERVAEIAARHAGAPVAVVVPRVGVPAEWARYERYVGSRLAGGKPERPPEVTAEVAISSGGQDVGAVLLLGPGKDDAGEYLHVAAIAALTEVAVAEARDETEQSLRGSFLEELLRRDDLLTEDVVRRGPAAGLRPGRRGGRAVRRAARGHAGPDRGEHRQRAARRARAGDRRTGLRARARTRSRSARKLATRLGRRATVGISSRYTDADRAAARARGGGARAEGERHRRGARGRGRREHLPAALPRAREPARGDRVLLRGHGRVAGRATTSSTRPT